MKLGEKKKERKKQIIFRPFRKTKLYFDERLKGWEDWERGFEMRDEMLSDLINREIKEKVIVKNDNR